MHYKTPGVLYQDGRFLDAPLGVRDDDLIVLADADGIFQRDFTTEELTTLHDLRGGFALGYNMRPGQQGQEEYQELRPKQSIEVAAELLNLPIELLRGAWIYNTGLMVGRVKDWKRLRKLFAETFGDRGPGLFQLHSWPQYFLCLTFSLHGIPITELGYETHSHGHFPLTPRHAIERRQLYYGKQLVLYAHNVSGVTH